MAEAAYYQLLTGTLGLVNTLGLVFDAALVPVAIRKLPKREENLDTVPLLVIPPSDRPEEVIPITPGYVEVVYGIQIVLIASNDGDQFTDLNTWLKWREQVRRLFQVPTPFALVDAQLFDVDMVPEVPIDREKINQNYDYSALKLQFHVLESRS